MKTTVRLAAVASLTAASFGLVAAAPAGASTSGPVATYTKAKCNQAIDERLFILDISEQRIEKVKRLTADQKAAQIAGIDGVQANLVNVNRPAVNNAKGKAGIKAACSAIYADNRVYAVVIPQLFASVRIDAGFPSEDFLSALEQRRTAYVARIKNNSVLDRMAHPFLRRPCGRPPTQPRTWFHELGYKAGPWSHERRLVLVVVERPGQLLLDHFWLVTNWTQEQRSGEELLACYRERGTAEGHQGELKSVLEPALSSSPRPKSTYRGQPPKRTTPSIDSFAHNETILLLNLLAYNILHVARVLLETSTQEGWSLKRLRERVLRIPARVLLHGRRATLVIGEAAAHLWRHLWRKLALFEAVPTS